MRRHEPLVVIAIVVFAFAAVGCGSKSGSSRGNDGAAGSTTASGGSATGGSVSGSGGAGGRTGGGGSLGLGGTAKDASSGDAPRGTDAPPQPTDGTTAADVALTCPDHLPVLPAYPYTPEICSTDLNVSKLRCTYSAPLLGADGGPNCDQTYFCQCVSGQGGPVACYWQADANPICPDGGTTLSDASRADASRDDAPRADAPLADAPRADTAAVDTAATPLCGAKTCAADEVCCGPAECGRCLKALTGPNCPSSCSASMCGPSGQPCATGEICVDVALSAGPMIGSTTATCITNPCGTQALDCSCASDACTTVSAQTTCTSVDPATGLVRCVGGNKCAAPDTPIATPTGDRAIADLRPGDRVFSVDHGALVAVPLLRVSRTPAAGHFVVHLVTARGAVLDISGPHPTADGRRFSDLTAGDVLDGDAIVVRDVVPYPHAFTYDILPASSTGTYVAAGLLIGSTLK